VSDDVLRTVLQVVRTHIPPGDTPVRVSPESLLSELGFQSLAIVRLIVSLEAELGLELPADLVDGEVFRTPSTIADAIRPLVRG
jgi:acyl carrier protein